ncbi:hypothetical protein R1sor_003899 [Riccia sorocarpa]|uniref:RING-CH-type domain-containing protein n=1 Tax=Riccia sorocarpa TaxID=122646 RepID=A0ABD3H2Z8_9MARC
MADAESASAGFLDSPSLPGQLPSTSLPKQNQEIIGFEERGNEPVQSDDHVIDVPVEDGPGLDSYKTTTSSALAGENSTGNFCRICLLQTEEVVVELGCHCRGELAVAHQICMEQWFRGSHCSATNNCKCKICGKAAVNVPSHVVLIPQRIADVPSDVVLAPQRIEDVAGPATDGEYHSLLQTLAVVCIVLMIRGYRIPLKFLILDACIMTSLGAATTLIVSRIYRRCFQRDGTSGGSGQKNLKGRMNHNTSKALL